MASLYDSPDLYDLIASPDAAMQAFYVDAAKSNGPSVLELACGSGRLTIPLAEAGLEVTGIDLSETMLARAREAAVERRVGVELLPADMRSFDLSGRRFETVMVAANSIMHLLTPADFRGFFRSVARHLTPDGQLLFDCFVPSVALLSRPGIRQAMTTAVHPSLGEMTVEEIIDYDPLTQVAHTTWYWSPMSARDFHTMTFDLRSIFPQELPLLLWANNFKLVERFGDFDRGPLAPPAYRQVCICAAIEG